MENNILMKENEPKNLSLETFKSMLYWLNAKPDTDIRVFHESKNIEIEKINSLNERIVEKLKTHDILSYMTTIEIILKDWNIKSYGTWEEFQSTNWNIPWITESINIKWDINVKLSHYELPQRHTLRVRLRSELKPKEYFELLTNSENDSEAIQWKAFLVAKIDFINASLWSELLNVVENWYKILTYAELKPWVQKVIEKYKETIARFSEIFVIIIWLSIFYSVLNYFNLFNILGQTDTLKSIFIAIWLLIIAYKVSEIMSNYVWRKIYKKISKIEEQSIFFITTWDENEKIRREKKNKSLILKMFIQVILLFIWALISIFLEVLLKSIM